MASTCQQQSPSLTVLEPAVTLDEASMAKLDPVKGPDDLQALSWLLHCHQCVERRFAVPVTAAKLPDRLAIIGLPQH